MYTEGQVLYRAYVDRVEVVYDEYRVEKVTPKGAWVVPHVPGNPYSIHQPGSTRYCPSWEDKERRWVPLDAKFCSETKDLALDRLRARTRAYVRHARRRLNEAEERARVLGISTAEPKRFHSWSGYDY